MPKFSDSPYFVAKTLVKSLPVHDYTYPSKAQIKTLNNKIVAKGYGMDVYLKTNLDYMKIKLTPISGTPTDNYFKFNLETSCFNPSVLTFADIVDYVSEGYNEVYFLKALPSPLHSFVERFNTTTWTKRHIQYDASDTWTIEHRFNTWRNYRNESNFTIVCTDLAGATINYEYSTSTDENNITLTFKTAQSGVATLSLSGQQPLDHFVNNNKPYLFFGTINGEGTNIVNVQFNGMKDYVMEALPYNNRTDLLNDFMEVSFDRMYQQIYHLIGDVWNMQDPNEVNIDFLHYIYQMYSMGQMTLLPEAVQRQYAAGLVDLMKRKGSYSSLYVIWKAIASYSTNFLNVYERWHAWTIHDNVPLGHFEDYLYTSYPLYLHTPPIGGAGSAYYGASQTTTGGEAVDFMSPVLQWNVNHSLATLNVICQCYDSNYESITPSEIEVIDANNVRVTFNTPMSGHIHIIDADEMDYGAEAAEWTITHSTGSKDVIAMPMDYNRTYMIPNRLTLDTTSQYTVSWDPNAGTYRHDQVPASASWTVNHTYGTTIDTPGFYDMVGNQLIPTGVTITSNKVVATFSSPESGYAIISRTDTPAATKWEGLALTEGSTYLYAQAVADTTWTIAHTYGIYIIAQFYDANYNMIVPNSMKITNNMLVATFDGAIAGYAVINQLSSTRIYPEDPWAVTDLMMSPHYRVEIDLSNEPVNTYSIMDETTITTLTTEWERMRPVCKFAHYSMVVAPLTNFSRFYIPMYAGGNTKANLNTICIPVVDNPNEDCAVYWRQHRNIKWVVAHRLHSTDVIVQCYDLNGLMIEPISQTNINWDYVEIHFSSPQAGYAYSCIADSATSSIPASATWGLVHTIGQQFPLVQIDDEDYGKLIPKMITMPGVNEYSVTFTHAQAGFGFTLESEQIPSGSGTGWGYEQTTASSTWTVNHMLDSQAVQVTCYNDNDEVIYPADVYIASRNHCIITFGSAITGKAVVRGIGRKGYLMADIYSRLSYAQVGSGTSGIAWKAKENNALENLDATYNIDKATDANYFYAKVIVDTDVDMEITEIGIFDSYNELCFYSYCAPIYKPANVDLYLWIRIEKTLEYNQ